MRLAPLAMLAVLCGHPAQAWPGRTASAPPEGPPRIRGVIRARLPAIRHCFERARRADQAEGGTLVVAFTFDGLGRVTAVTSQADPGVRALEPCVQALFWPLRFPATGTPVHVSHPFTFHAPG
jgi:hypothetical protein